ncbi:MAG TPA: methyltransferase domain-containing protein [Mycobacteriales bacterium]|nr:methyltransferase domain-containing protein [Mycobacteriales bacterium]
MTEQSPAASELSDDELRSYVASRSWYHTVELREGIETPGWFDTRPTAKALPWPELSGARCLDVGTFEGFWAREMKQRGAAEVVAIDILDPRKWDWPAGSTAELLATLGERKQHGEGFHFVNDALGGGIEHRELSVYDLDPATVGEFDMVYVGSLLLHLRDPIGALERVRSVCGDGARAIFVDAIDLGLTVRHPRRPHASLDAVGRPWWWLPNAAALRRMVEAAGFEVRWESGPIYLRPGAGQRLPRYAPWMPFTRKGREIIVTRLRGNPHAAILAVPSRAA